MEPMLRDYIERLFLSAPATRQAYELKEEIIRNTIERYHDLLEEGKTEGDAYNLAIAGIGDISELINELDGEPVEEVPAYTTEQMNKIKGRKRIFNCVAIALYILCVTPCILLGNTSLADISPAFMFFMISVATGLLIYGSMTKTTPLMGDFEQRREIKTRAVLRSVSVGLYISCVTPCILLSGSQFETLSFVLMLLLIAAATVLIILSKGKDTYTRQNDTMVESFKEWNSESKRRKGLYRVLVAILWVTASVIYIALTLELRSGFLVTWIVFLIAAALQGLMRAIFDYVGARK